MSRSDKFTLTQKKRIVYSDITTNFDRNPHTGFLSVVTNEESVAQMLKSLFLTNEGERFGNADFGGGIKGALFENMDGGKNELMKLEMNNLISTYLPMVAIVKIDIFSPYVRTQEGLAEPGENDGNNTLDIKITYRIDNIVDEQVLDLNIKRVR